MGYHESLTEGRNAVLEAFRSGKTVDRLFVLDGCQDGPVKTILREAKKQDTMVQYVKKERLDQLSETKNHQGVIAYCAACEYAEVSDILENAKKKGAGFCPGKGNNSDHEKENRQVSENGRYHGIYQAGTPGG